MRPTQEKRTCLKRWLIFNSVGAMGILVQLSTLLALTQGARLHYLPASGLAVEAAVLHNFLWHERWTWADRLKNAKRGFWKRLLGFHGANGVLSLAGNLLLMRLFVEHLNMPYLPANALAIALCSILTFLAGDLVVFRTSGPARRDKSRDANGNIQRKRLLIPWAVLPLFAVPPSFPSASAADLSPGTMKAWRDSVDAVERRIANEIYSPKGFLAMDFLDATRASREREAALSGEILVVRIKTRDEEGRPIPVPGGEIHHWRGAVFIPGITLENLLARLENPSPSDSRQEDVLESAVLEKGPGRLKLYFKLQRSKIVTVRYNTEHLVQYRRHSKTRASSSSVAVKIAEIERLGDNTEREKPEGHDRGFLWRMNSYWRYEQANGGVMVECESMTLSRSVPPVVEYLARPIINRVARESMRRTLECMRSRMTPAQDRSLAKI